MTINNNWCCVGLIFSLCNNVWNNFSLGNSCSSRPCCPWWGDGLCYSFNSNAWSDSESLSVGFSFQFATWSEGNSINIDFNWRSNCYSSYFSDIGWSICPSGSDELCVCQNLYRWSNSFGFFISLRNNLTILISFHLSICNNFNVRGHSEIYSGLCQGWPWSPWR